MREEPRRVDAASSPGDLELAPRPERLESSECAAVGQPFDDALAERRPTLEQPIGVNQPRCIVFRVGCDCRVCVQARTEGRPYSRSGPSTFVHGPDVLIDTPEEIRARASRIQELAVSSTVMPIGNVTKMTKAERSVLGQWIAQGASLK